MKVKALLILLIILLALIPVYAGIGQLQKSIRPRESLPRLFVYMLSAFCLIFLVTFLIVFIIKQFFPVASE